MVEDVLREVAAGDVADLQLETVVLARRVGDGERAPPAVAQHVQVLAGQILQPLGSRQRELQADDVVGKRELPRHPAGKVAHDDVLLGAELLDLDAHIAERTRHAQKREALGGVER